MAHFHRVGDQRHLAFFFLSSSSFSFFFFVFIIYGIPLGIFKTCFAIFGYPPVAYLTHMSPNTHLIWKSGYFFFYGFHMNTKFSVKYVQGFTQQNEIKEKIFHDNSKRFNLRCLQS